MIKLTNGTCTCVYILLTRGSVLSSEFKNHITMIFFLTRHDWL